MAQQLKVFDSIDFDPSKINQTFLKDMNAIFAKKQKEISSLNLFYLIEKISEDSQDKGVIIAYLSDIEEKA